MGTRSSKYTKWPKGRPDPRILDDEAWETMSTLAMIRDKVAAAHPSTRRERRSARKLVRLHMKVRLGSHFDFQRQFMLPKFPNRTATKGVRVNVDDRKFG